MATVSAEELNVQVERLYTGTDYFYACLVDTAGATVAAGTSLVDFRLRARSRRWWIFKKRI